MRRDEFETLLHDTFGDIVSINKTKGHDYAGDEDALSNFKVQAEKWGLTPVQVWGVFFGKHMSAIETYVREGDVQSEPIEGRIEDAILYLFLLRGLVEEKNNPPVNPFKTKIVPVDDIALDPSPASGNKPLGNGSGLGD